MTPPSRSRKTTDATEDEPAPAPIPPTNTPETGNSVPKGKGSFATHSFTLKKNKETL